MKGNKAENKSGGEGGRRRKEKYHCTRIWKKWRRESGRSRDGSRIRERRFENKKRKMCAREE